MLCTDAKFKTQSLNELRFFGDRRHKYQIWCCHLLMLSGGAFISFCFLFFANRPRRRAPRGSTYCQAERGDDPAKCLRFRVCAGRLRNGLGRRLSGLQPLLPQTQVRHRSTPLSISRSHICVSATRLRSYRLCQSLYVCHHEVDDLLYFCLP